MEAISYVQRVEYGKVLIENLEKFSGLDVKIIIIPLEHKNCISREPSKGDWRDKMKTRLKLLVEPEKIIEPIEDIWEGYI